MLSRLRFASPPAQTVLLWSGVAIAAFLIFRTLLPPRPALAPLLATVGFMLAAFVLYSMRERVFVRSLAFAFVGVCAYLFAWNRGVPMLYSFSAVCFGIVVVSHLLPRLVLKAVQGRLAAPPWIYQGDAARIGVVLSNPAPAPIRMIELELPFEGALTEEKWARAVIVELGAGAQRELAMRTPALRRGRHFAGPLTVRCGFPLGLAFAEEKLENTGRHIWVYPRLFDVGFVPIAGEQFLDMGDAISPKSGGIEEFAGVREYRHGDSRRHVHWRASARRGELVVKEFTRRSAATVTVAVDLAKAACIGEGVQTTTEYAVSAAASVARFALERGHYVQLALCGHKLRVIGPLRGAPSLEDVLRALALAQADGVMPFSGWLARLMAVAPQDSTVVPIYTDTTAGSMAALSSFWRRGVLVVPVIIDAESFGAKSRVAGAPRLRARERRWRKGEDPAALFRK